jgi:hypothetical protein
MEGLAEIATTEIIRELASCFIAISLAKKTWQTDGQTTPYIPEDAE